MNQFSSIMNSSPLISIITVTYNAATCIEPTMLSIAGQTFRKFEHIVIDGASKDDTLSIVRRIDDARILSEKDNGLYDAMNKGISLSRGKYLLFLNAGDTFHTNKTLAEYAQYAERGDDIIYSDTVIVDQHRHIISNRHLKAPVKLTRESFADGMLICHQAFMVRKDLAPQYDLKYRFSADYDWTVRCISNANPDRCTNLNIIGIDYLREGMTDKNKLKSLLERYKIMTEHYGKIPTLLNHIRFLMRATRRRLQK